MTNNISLPLQNYTRISSQYGLRNNPTGSGTQIHKGIDFASPTGTPIYAVRTGTITQIGLQDPSNSSVGLGQRITIDYADDLYDGRYGHLSEFALNPATGLIFKKDDKVEAGQLIGYVGSTGRSTGPHLHYEESYFDSHNEKHDRNPMPQFESLINNKNIKPSLTINLQDLEVQQAIDLILGKSQSTNPNQTLINDLSDYTRLTINNTTTNSYLIQSGDTFNNIANRLINEGKINSVQDLIDANPDIENLDSINVGDTINIPTLKSSENYSILSDPSIKHYADSGMIGTDGFYYVDASGNELAGDDLNNSVIKTEDESGNFFTLVKDNVFIPLKDGTLAAVESIIEMTQTAQVITEEFINGYVGQVTNLFTNPDAIAGLISDVATGIQRGDSPEEIAKFIATKLAVKQLLEQGSSIIKQQIQEALVDNAADIAAIESGNMLELSAEGAKALQGLESITNHPAFNYGYMVAISFATTLLLNANEGWDSEEYTQAAVQTAAQVGAQVAVQIAVQNGLIGSSVGAGAGAAIATLVSAAITDLFADDHMNSHQWQSTFATAGVMFVAAAAGSALATAMVVGSFAGPIGAVVAVIIVSQFMGGREYGPGEYPDPYSYLQTEPKLDENGNPTGDYNIIGIEPEGVVAIAREYYHDDLYGNSGSDNLIGKSGTNTIMGYDGNDHIEGRGDVDLLIGGKGDDEIFGGNGNDQIFGSQGNDNLFGGNGDDVIIGDTGSELTADDLSLITNADFIQGGNGNDQIMGEYGDDTIAGNDGDDIILGGTGDDRIEGNEGSDSILGEDGDDVILGGNGSDIIDGGAGVDVIYGNEGNDNIRGGDDNDEIYGNEGVDIIYGDSGNDLINSGADNDLVFGGISNDIVYGADGDDSLYGEIGNDYVIGGNGDDTVDGGAGDDVLMGGAGNDTINTGQGNDTIIYRLGDGDDMIIETESAGNDTLKLSEINSKLSNNTTNKIVLTKSGNDLLIQLRDDNNNIIANNSITVKDQFTGSEILKKIEFADGYHIDLTNLTTIPALNGEILLTTYDLRLTTNIDTSIQEELILGYNDIMQVQEEQNNPNSTYDQSNYNTSGEQEEIDNERYNEMQWHSYKKKRNVFGGYYTVWYKYYEQNLSGTNGNDRIVGHWWSENIYGGDGDDQLNGGDGNDNLYGGTGDDILHGGTGNDNIYGQEGNDRTYGGSGNDFIEGGSDNDQIYGNTGDDIINGDKTNDILSTSPRDWNFDGAAIKKRLLITNKNVRDFGLAGDDYIEGGDGNDIITDISGHNIIIAGNGNDQVQTGAGEDYIEGNDGSDLLNAGAGNDLVYGGGDNDIINGEAGNDSLYGQEGSDLINGNDGDDLISAGSGQDLINGNDGNDTVYGDLGIDIISGGNNDDYIYGGSGADIISGDDETVDGVRIAGAGNDLIKGGEGEDWIEGDAGDDIIYGDSGSDKVYGGIGNDTIYGGLDGDVLEGDAGDDIINGGLGNDILVDGAGSDNLDGGLGSDILILTKELTTYDLPLSTIIDTINNFNKTEDKIILKVDYQNPISFADIQAGMVQSQDDAQINLDNGQKIIIKNTNIADINASNFQIGLSGGENNDILFGTNGEDIIFGDGGDDEIYGGEGNDELWGGKGADALYGEGGDDILRYEADGKYSEVRTEIYFDEVGNGFTSYNIGGGIGFWLYFNTFYDNTPGSNNGDRSVSMYDGNPLLTNFITTQSSFSDDIIQYSSSYVKEAERNIIPIIGSLTKSAKTHIWEWFYDYNHYSYDYANNILQDSQFRIELNYTLTKISYEYTINNNYSTKNFHTSELTDITGHNRTFDKFIGGSGINTILMTEGNDVLALDDQASAGASDQARVRDISVIHAGAGDDIINFSTQKYSYGDAVVYGGTGNDKIWLSSGNDQIFGGEGNDEIYSGTGNDNLVGGLGDDLLFAGIGNDILEGSGGANQLNGEDGDDIFIGGSGSDTINGGTGNDTISYANSAASVAINLANNSTSDGAANNDAANDLISSIENITGSSWNDTLIGNDSNNIFNGNGGNDSISGSLGDDTYIYNQNSGSDTIIETGSGVDSIQFGLGIEASDLTFATNGNDLEIQVGNNSANKLILKNQLTTTDKIEFLKFGSAGNGILALNSFANSEQSPIDISKQFFITNEDQQLILNPNSLLPNPNSKLKNLSASYGSIIFDEESNRFLYQGLANFHGIDEITLIEEDETQRKFTIFVNGVNDAPIGDVANMEVKVEEEFSINLKDYFSDVDGDDITLLLKLKNSDHLPDWINFNEATGVLSGKSGRDGRLNFTITATDPSGAIISDDFTIKITRDIAEDIIPDAPIMQIIGTNGDDILTATENSADIIMAGDGDDIIEYGKDGDWLEVDNFIYSAWNIYSGDQIIVTGKQRSYDAFDGGNGYDKINLTSGNDVMFLDDAIVSNIGEIAKLSSIEEINAGDGDDVIDLTSLNFSYEDVIINGGNGDDVLWGNDGDDILNGEEGNDNLQGGKGNDIIDGGNGDDIIKGYDGNDSITGGNGFDMISGGAGNDIFIFTNKTDSAQTISEQEADMILDFIQGEDKIDLSTLGFQSITFGQNSNISADGLEYYYQNGDTIIDDPNSNFGFRMAGEINLNHNDFNF
ncbi:MAG: peptidoglycan DD-metalloendopeptidase family protein [Pseudomonadota bacterium]